jgi:inosine/xanthosine triphosphate pyrophosphatase family protein
MRLEEGMMRLNVAYVLLLMASLVTVGISDPFAINESNLSMMANYSLHNESKVNTSANESDPSPHIADASIVALESLNDFPEVVTANYASDLGPYNGDVTSNEKLVDQIATQMNDGNTKKGNQYAQALGIGSATNNVEISTNNE